MHMDEQQASAQNDAGTAANMRQITPQLLSDQRKYRELHASPDIGQLLSNTAPYRIDSGDILSIVVWAHPELSVPTIATAVPAGADNSGVPGFVVDDKGLVQFPYAGTVKLAGLTTLQARDLLVGKLSRYFKQPDLTLRVQAYRSKRVYLQGEVKAPGIQTINDVHMTLMEGLNRAGGILPTGDKSQISVQRGGKTYMVDLALLEKKGIDPNRILLANDDVVEVLSRDESKIFVLGEVSRPTTLTLRNGHLTLREALGDAGGLNPLTSQARQVYVIRNDRDAKDVSPLVYHLDASSPIAFVLAEKFELEAKDVVYVDAAPLATWSRVVSLIIPSAQSVTSAVQAGK
jgi:polysaccharide export outer membrane protein